MIRCFLILLINLLLFASCKQTTRDHSPGIPKGTPVPVKFAGGFRAERSGNDRLITITNPWQKAANVSFSYLLSDTLKQSHIIDATHCRIKTPVKRVICLSTTHIGYIDFLAETSSIVGLSGTGYVTNEKLLKKISVDSMPDVGYDENLNFELILKLHPDVVIAYGVSGSITNTIRKLNEMGIPTMLIAEYLEEEPLAKMEWLKVFAALYNKWDVASEKFDSSVARYQRLKEITSGIKDKPSVLLGLPWRGTWYVSGGNSYVARMIKDAGGKYVFDHLEYSDSRPVSLEEVYSHALSADFWLNTGDALSLKDLFSVDNRFRNLLSIKNNRIFNNNKLNTPEGGNAIYESGVVEPEIILGDLIYILHPQLLPSHQLKYYRQLH